MPTLAGKPAHLSVDETFVTLERTSEITGIMAERLLRLAASKKMAYRGSQRDPLFALSTVQALLAEGEAYDASRLMIDRISRAATTPPSGKFLFNRVVTGHVLDVVATMPPGCVQAVVTSPPFWGQRVYADETAVKWNDSDEAPFGRENTPEAYVRHTLQVLASLARVLKPRGTIWWNLGDSYMTRTIARASSLDRVAHYGGKRTTWADNPHRRWSSGHPVLKDKDLSLVPFKIAMGAQRLGYWVRSVIVWSKQHTALKEGEVERRAHMPEVVADRPVTGHEYILLLTKSVEYDYHASQAGNLNGDGTKLNVRTVWTFRPTDKGASHGARFPVELPRRCIQLGTRPRQLVFDPFAGSGSTLLVARQLKRQFFGCDISPTYVNEATRLLAASEQMPLPDG